MPAGDQRPSGEGKQSATVITNFDGITKEEMLSEEGEKGESYQIAGKSNQRFEGTARVTGWVFGKIASPKQGALQKISPIAARRWHDLEYFGFIAPNESATLTRPSPEKIQIFMAHVELCPKRWFP